eukprot:6491521-Amphidinium_carterae.3
MPGLSTWVTSFGPFSGRGGRLWVFDQNGSDEPPSETRESIPPGARGSFKTTYHRWVRLDGMNWHAVEAPKDTRYSLSVFTIGSLHLLSERHCMGRLCIAETPSEQVETDASTQA